MFQKDQWIVYGSTGVCRVAQIGPLKELSGADPDTLYYTLEPLCGTDIIYVPVDTQAFMRPVITRQQALDPVSYTHLGDCPSRLSAPADPTRPDVERNHCLWVFEKSKPNGLLSGKI